MDYFCGTETFFYSRTYNIPKGQDTPAFTVGYSNKKALMLDEGSCSC